MSVDWLFSDGSSDDSEVEKIEVRRKRAGRPSLHEQYVELVPCIEEFIKQGTAAAHLRRRDSVMYMNGVSLEQIKKHVNKKLNIEISRDTIHRLMRPRRSGTHQSKRFKSLINARIPPKNNGGEREIHPDFHYTCAQVNMVNEMANVCQLGTVQMSVDNKNKVDVGTLAVNRRCKINTFYLESDAPVYNDHDFPYRNSKLTPAGYQILIPERRRCRSVSPPRSKKEVRTRRRTLSSSTNFPKRVKVVKDKIGRDKIKWSREGPLTVELYPSRTMEATNIMHVRRMSQMLRKDFFRGEIFNVVAIADGGPDWSVKGLINFMSLGLFWLECRLDIVVVQSYAPGHSRFNPIERCWSFLTKWLVGVTLPADINGVVPKENDEEGWNIVLDNASQFCAKFWDGKKVHGHKITTKAFLSSNPDISHLKMSHKLLQDLSNASARKIRESMQLQELQTLYQFLVLHCNRKPYQIEFIRCVRKNCGHCRKLPCRDNPLLQLLDDFGRSFPVPTESRFHRGHFDNFKDTYQSLSYKRKQSSIITHGVCPHGCNYCFFSNADKQRHFKLMGHK